MTGTRTDPIRVPGPGGETAIAREPMWHAWAGGDDHPAVPAWMWAAEPPPAEHVPPSLPVSSDGRQVALPSGTTDLLEGADYPTGRVHDAADPVAHALVAAFGPCRREPDNPYNDHRPYASARCLFPVQVVLRSGGLAWLLDPDQQRLVDLDAHPSSALTAVTDDEVVLTGHYPAIPRDYKWFRGSLVALELGITLRSLCLALELFGIPARLRLPGPDALDRLVGLGLGPADEWSLPLTVELGSVNRRAVGFGAADIGAVELGAAGRVSMPVGHAPMPADRERPLAAGDRSTVPPADAVLQSVLDVDRAQSFDAPPAELGTAIPALPAGASGLSWAELLWRRHAGRMPRGLHGMSGRCRRVPAAALSTMARWVAVPPPGLLAPIFRDLQVTAVLQGVDGTVDGVHQVHRGVAALRIEDPTAPARLESAYGYGLTPGNGCDVRHACMIWFLSVRPREVVRRYGPGGWSSAQQACGWAAHGLCLGAAAAGLFGRPVRAFTEVAVKDILRLEPEDMVVLAVVAGIPRHLGGTVLDIRT